MKFDVLDYLKRVFKRTAAEGLEEVHTPQHEEAAFVLRYEDLVVGYLRLHEGLWDFRYSEEFQQQSEVQPLVGFPSVDKAYQSTELWPFFMARIPSLAQPKVREFVDRTGLDEHNSADLLRAFGKRSISNPFVLEEMIAA
jgi:HipA-like protein